MTSVNSEQSFLLSYCEFHILEIKYLSDFILLKMCCSYCLLM